MRVIELFAGAGGLGLGVSMAGFSPARIVEWDRWCCDTIRENRRRRTPIVANWPEPFEGDVRDLDFRDLRGKSSWSPGDRPANLFRLAASIAPTATPAICGPKRCASCAKRNPRPSSLKM